jgi:capsular exopolysaccharide synthesis family protein
MGRIRIKLEDADLNAAAKLALMESLEKEESSFGAQPNVGESPAAVSAWPELVEEQQRLKKAIAEQSATQPEALQSELESVTRKLASEYQSAKKRFELDYQEILNRRSEMENDADDSARSVRAGDQEKQAPTASQKTRPNWERMLSDLQKKIQALEDRWKKEQVNLAFVSLQENRALPVPPGRGNLIALSLGTGIFLALVIPLLLEFLNRRRHDCRHVESAFQIRQLGKVPELSSDFGADALQPGAPEETGLTAAFAAIRRNLSTGEGKIAPKVIMVASAMPKEGKTVVAANLAVAFARDGARTLIIDTDLRGGKLHRLFGYRKSPGLADVLLDQVGLDAACRPTNHPNLCILSAGNPSGDEADLLGLDMFEAIITTVRDHFDRIIVDAPAVLGSSEDRISQQLIDGVLFVIRSGHTPAKTTTVAIETLQKDGASLCGFVRNRVSAFESGEVHETREVCLVQS